MTQHYHSPPRDHQNQHTQKCSVYTRRCLALQCTLISCSSSSFCSTGLSVTSPRSRSESVFIPLQGSGTTCVVSSILVCFFLGTFATLHHSASPNTFLAALSIQNSALLLLYSWRWLIPLYTWPLPLGSVHHVWLPLWHPVLNISWPHTSHTVSLLHFEHPFCYSVTQPFSTGAFIDPSHCFLFCN